MSETDRPKIVVLGTMSTMPVAGVVWQYLHYIMGFEDLGYEAWYVEDHGIWPPYASARFGNDGAAESARVINDVLSPFDMAGRWAYRSRHSDDVVYGMSKGDLSRLFRDACLVVNMHGSTWPRPEHSNSGRLAFIDTDPVKIQIWIDGGMARQDEYLQPHSAFFTFGENIGTDRCDLPSGYPYQFQPTRQPVVIRYWAESNLPLRYGFTTIGHWRQDRPLVWRGQRYAWSKREEFRKVLRLPSLVGAPFELALSEINDDDRRHLVENGWVVSDALEISRDLSRYAAYIHASLGEFTVAKQQNVELNTGWFSDRSATYLAAGRPVVTQDTGFGDILPTGRGLYAFRTPEEAAEACLAVVSESDANAKAAAEIAREYFSHDVVLGHLLERFGLPRSADAVSHP
jgi:hypothetical protein